MEFLRTLLTNPSPTQILIMVAAFFCLVAIVTLVILLKLMDKFFFKPQDDPPGDFDEDMIGGQDGVQCASCLMLNQLLANGLLPQSCHFCGNKLEPLATWLCH